MKRSTKTPIVHQGVQMLFYSPTLPVVCQTLPYTAGSSAPAAARSAFLAASSAAASSPGLPAQGEKLAELAAGFGVGAATAWRYLTDIAALSAAQSPKLGQALEQGREARHANLVIDSTLIPIDRARVIKPASARKRSMQLRQTLPAVAFAHATVREEVMTRPGAHRYP